MIKLIFFCRIHPVSHKASRVCWYNFNILKVYVYIHFEIGTFLGIWRDGHIFVFIACFEIHPGELQPDCQWRLTALWPRQQFGCTVSNFRIWTILSFRCETCLTKPIGVFFEELWDKLSGGETGRFGSSLLGIWSESREGEFWACLQKKKFWII
jgi:hypothetical protein